MRRDDLRSRRVAIVADFLVNPDAAFYHAITARTGPVFDVLVEDGWGLMKMPPHVLPQAVARSTAQTIAGDASDYLRYDHQVVIIAAEGLPQGGVWLEELNAAFRDLKVKPPPVVTVPMDGAAATAASIRALLPKISPTQANPAA